MRHWLIAAGVLAFSTAASAQAPPGEPRFREIYREMVEIDSSPTTGSCTRVAEAAAARLRAAGYDEASVHLVIPEGKPDDGNVVAILPGDERRAGAVLLLAHIDVVDARREDWTRDPFTLVEENGFYYGRGTSDDKSMAAIFLDLMIRLKEENFRARRTLKLALTCGEETSNRVNGVQYLLENHRALIDADFALNEGAGGILSEDGRPLALLIQAGEKIHQVFQLEVTNPGGHSSRPVAENAIYRLAAGLQRLSAYQFPIELTPATRGFFERMAPITGGEIGEAMAAIARNPADAQAGAALARDASFNAMMRTTCVATQLDAGHAPNALPQRARAILSCRILQGHTPEEVKAELERVLSDAQISVTIVRRREGSPLPPLTRQILGPAESVGRRLWPGVPLVPVMLAGATDGRHLNAAGIETYGLSGLFAVPGETNAHGLNEKIRVQSLMEGRAFLDAVVREYARSR